MTSTPVTVNAGSYYTRAVNTATSAGTDVKNSFSDVLMSQKSDGQTKDVSELRTEDKRTSRTDTDNTPKQAESTSLKKAEGKAETCETKPVKKQEKEAEESVEAAAGEAVAEVVTAAAAKLLAETAKELDMTEEDVLALLNELGMTPMDLLEPDSMQEFVMKAFGETDKAGFVTNEQLFQSFQNMMTVLDEVVSEVAEATGLDEDAVRTVFEQLQSEPEAESTVISEVNELTAEQLPQQTYRQETKEPDGVTKQDTTSAAGAQKEVLTVPAGEASDRAQEQETKDAGSEQHMNLFTMQLNAKAVQAEGMQSVQEMPVFDADTEMIMQQITEHIRSHVTEGVSELEMQLHPESLGNLHVKLTAKDGLVTAQFTAQNDAVKTALETQMVQLKESFKEQGIEVNAIEVTVESHRFDENLNGNSNQGNGESGQPAGQKSRRLNLNLLNEDEDFTEEEKLTAEMLKANGNTVDYTA